MAKGSHKCKDNDSISNLSNFYDFFDWNSIWQENKGKGRENPNVLFKAFKRGKSDTLKIPQKTEKKESCACDNEKPHVFEVTTFQLCLRLRILNVDFTPIKNASYELTIEGCDKPYKDKTSDKGEIIAKDIPAKAQSGNLTVRLSAEDAKVKVPLEDSGDSKSESSGAEGSGSADSNALESEVPVTWELKIGRLNPLMEKAPDKYCVSSVQQRLNNLGINSGPVDGIKGSITKAAIETFQSMFSLKKDGSPGQNETQPKLVDIHDKNTYLGDPPPKSAVGISPIPKKKKLKTEVKDIGHVAADFSDGTFYNTLVVRPEYRISLQIGDIENLFPDAPDTIKGRMARLQVLGYYYFPLEHNISKTAADGSNAHAVNGWRECLKHVKTKILKLPDTPDNTKLDEAIQILLKNRIIHGGMLPSSAENPKKTEKKHFRKIRIPGGFTFFSYDHNDASGLQNNVDAAYDFRFTNSYLHSVETKFYDDNPVLGKIPLIAKVERKIGSKWLLAKDVTVYFKLEKPYALPEYDFSTDILEQVNRPPLRKSAILPSGYKKKNRGPKKLNDAWEKANPPDENDPQADNCHSDYEGKRGRGNLNDGTDVENVIFSTEDVKGFNSDHSGTRKVPHKHFPVAEVAGEEPHLHAVKAKTNEEGRAGVIFMPSWCGGDRYRFRMYVGPPSLMNDGTGEDGVRVETGTLVVWRNVRLSRYVRQDVSNTINNTILNDSGAASNNQYHQWLGAVNSSGNFEGLADPDFSTKAEKKAGKVNGPFDGLIAQFARAFCELEKDFDGDTPEILTDAEWKAAVKKAISDGEANKAHINPRPPGYDWNDLNVSKLFYDVDDAGLGLTAQNTGTNLPLRHPVDYYNDATTVTPPLSGGNIHPNWISGIENFHYSFLWPGFSRHLSKDGFLPGITVIQAGMGSSWQMFGQFDDFSGLAAFFRACYIWYGKSTYATKVNKPPFIYSYTSNNAHEIGHIMFKVHAHTAPGAEADRHDPITDCMCVMSYTRCEGQYCGKCLFALRGWQIEGH